MLPVLWRTRPAMSKRTSAVSLLIVVSLLLLGFGGHLQRAAGAATVSVQESSNVVYAHDHGPLLMDIYRPSDAHGQLPALLLIHGGGWVAGDKSEFSGIAGPLAQQGYVVFNIDYGLATATDPGYPREVRDVRRAYDFVERNSSTYGADARDVGVAGSSAGGYLAAMLGAEVSEHGRSPIRAVVSLSGPMNLGALVALLRTRHVCRGLSSAVCRLRREAGRALLTFVGCRLPRCNVAALRRDSPVAAVSEYAPAFFLANSRHELVPASQATSMAAVLRAHHVPVELRVLSGSGHADDYAKRVAVPVVNFLAKHLGSSYRSRRAITPDPAGTDQGNLAAVALAALGSFAALSTLALVSAG